MEWWPFKINSTSYYSNTLGRIWANVGQWGTFCRWQCFQAFNLCPKYSPTVYLFLSFARIYYLFQTNPYLGPLQISLGCMLVDVAKFCIIFVLIISSFSIGLAQLYWSFPFPSINILIYPKRYYDANTPVCLAPDQCKMAPNAFSSIANSYMTLLWSLFSITKVEDTDVRFCGKIKNIDHPFKVLEAHHFTVWVGQG